MIEKKSAEDNFYLIEQKHGFEKKKSMLTLIFTRVRSTDRRRVAPLFFITQYMHFLEIGMSWKKAHENAIQYSTALHTNSNINI